MKKFLKILAGTVCIASVFLAGCEEPDGSCNLVWTLSWLAVATAAGLGLKRMEEAK